MESARRPVNAARWELGSVIIQAILQLAVMAVLARLISPSEFGLYAIAGIILGLVLMFSDIGVGPAVIQKKEITAGYINNAFTVSIALGCLGTLIIWIVAPWIASFFNQPVAVDLIRVTSFTLIIAGYLTVATALFERELNYRTLAIINITSYAIGFGFIGIGLALLRFGVWAIVIASLSQYTVRAIMFVLMGKQKVRFAITIIELKSLMNYGFGVTLARFFNYSATQIDSVIVGRWLGAFSLGIYQMAMTILDLPRRFLGSVLDKVVFASMTRVQDDIERLRWGYIKSLEVANLIMLPLAVFMIILAPEIVGALLGENWDDLILPLQIMLVQVPLRASIRMTDAVSGAVGKVYLLAMIKIWFAILVAIVVLFGAQMGLVGVAIALTVAVIGNWVVMVRLGLQIIKASVWDYLRTWIHGCMMGFIVFVITYSGIALLNSIEMADIFKLVILGTVLGLVIIVLTWIWPYFIGRTAAWLICDMGKHLPVLQLFFMRLEKKLVKDGAVLS